MLRAGAFAMLAAVAMFAVGCKTCGNHCGTNSCHKGGDCAGAEQAAPAGEDLEPVPAPPGAAGGY